jgi:hypothetical protein
MEVMDFVSASLTPFQDPDVALDEEAVLDLMEQRAQAEVTRALAATPQECGRRMLKRFLTRNGHNVESAMQAWASWVTWRHGT